MVEAPSGPGDADDAVLDAEDRVVIVHPDASVECWCRSVPRAGSYAPVAQWTEQLFPRPCA